MQIGTDTFAHRSVSDLRAIYRNARAVAMAARPGAYDKHGGFEAFAAAFMTEDYCGPLDYVQFALGQVATNLTVVGYREPSPESVAWGEFFGGEHTYDCETANRVINELLEAAR